ncbi:MAG: hypothetical protein V7633_930 [Pseudonocardia sp.]
MVRFVDSLAISAYAYDAVQRRRRAANHESPSPDPAPTATAQDSVERGKRVRPILSERWTPAATYGAHGLLSSQSRVVDGALRRSLPAAWTVGSVPA